LGLVWPCIGLAESGSTSGEGEAPPAGKPAAKPIELIPIDQIGVAAERAKGQVAGIRTRLAEEASNDDLIDSIPTRKLEVDALLASSEELRARDPNLVEVDQLRQEWRALDEALGMMQADLDERAAQLAEMREKLAAAKSVWSATIEAARADDEDPTLIEQIDGVLAEIGGVRDGAAERQGEVAALQAKVASLTEIIRVDVAKLTEIRRNLAGRIFEEDRPPMYSREFFELLDREEIAGRLAEHRDREVAALSRFAWHHRQRLTIHGLATVFLLAFMFTARMRVRRFRHEHEEDDPALDHMEAVFDRPVALALLLSIFVGLWGYEEIPPLAAPVIGATALLPAVLILKRLVERPVVPILYVLLVLYFVDRLNEAIAPLPGLPRIVFVGEMVVVLALVLWWRRPSRLADVSRQKVESAPFQWLGIALRIALLAAPLAILAEATGYTALARLLGGTLLSAGYAGMMLYGSALALDGLVAFLLLVRPLKLSGMVERHGSLIAVRIQRAIGWLVAALFFYVLLRRLEIVDLFEEMVVGIWTFEIPLIAIEFTIGSIVEFLIIVRLTFALAKFIGFFLEEEVYTRVRMPKGKPYAVSTLTRYMVLLVGFLLATFALGVDVNRFTVLAGAFGVGIGFGLQTVVNNFVSGIILLTEQPVQVGDTIELEGVFGEVQRIGIRSSTVRTWQGAEVIVPNAQLVSEQVTNWTLSDDRRRIEIPVGVVYGSDPKRVISILEHVATSHDHVLGDPGPVVLFMNFGDSALEFELRCWTDLTGQYMSIRSSVIVRIEEALRAAGITIPFPQRDLHLASVSPEFMRAIPGVAGNAAERDPGTRFEQPASSVDDGFKSADPRTVGDADGDGD